MQSVILEIAARHFLRILVVISVLVLYIGHNLPGGGFIGGLILGSAFVIYAMAFSVEETLTGQWVEIFPDSAFALKLGTPLLFDVGVYFTVAGMLTLVVFSIKGE